MLFFSSSLLKGNFRKTYAALFFSLHSTYTLGTLFHLNSSFNSFSFFENRRFKSSLLDGSSSLMEGSSFLNSLPQHKVSISQNDLN